MNIEVLNQCGKTADKIIGIIDGMGFTTEKHVAQGELKALITYEVRNLLSDVVTDFYNKAALVPANVIVPDETENFVNGETNPNR